MTNKKINKSLEWAIIDYSICLFFIILILINTIKDFNTPNEVPHEKSEESFIADCINDEFGVRYCEHLFETKDY
jgi:hypothetical protein